MDCRVCNSSDYDARNGLRLRGISVIAETAVSLILIGRLGPLVGNFVQTMRVPTELIPITSWPCGWGCPRRG